MLGGVLPKQEERGGGKGRESGGSASCSVGGASGGGGYANFSNFMAECAASNMGAGLGGANVSVAEGGPGPMEQANAVSLMALGDMGAGSMCGDGMGSAAGAILMKQSSSCTQDVRYKLRDLLAQTANGANASSAGNLSAGCSSGVASVDSIGRDSLRGNATDLSDDLVGMDRYSEEEDLVDGRERGRDVDRDRGASHSRKQRQPLRLQVLGGEGVVVKDEGVHDTDGNVYTLEEARRDGGQDGSQESMAGFGQDETF
ncbi:hypothetical protein F2P81_026113 [Scophthalmus maximus]|uniref:Uncharacterized protein n=1 Tax=Scophthalmus maximus TaxID=52904 RepID=A0A6A4RSP8_SCOMX|nr:hypothetical protein F2P81_026113 [Scophthalmus maximus]